MLNMSYYVTTVYCNCVLYYRKFDNIDEAEKLKELLNRVKFLGAYKHTVIRKSIPYSNEYGSFIFKLNDRLIRNIVYDFEDSMY